MELIELISIRIDEVRSQCGQDITELARRAGPARVPRRPDGALRDGDGGDAGGESL